MKSLDSKLYLKLQTENILKRVEKFDKLYLEFGGKIFDDYHCARVLQGFEIDLKVKMLAKIKNKVEVVIVINANDIEKSKQRSDINISYADDVLRLMDEFEKMGILVSSVVITQYANQPFANVYRNKLDHLGIKSYIHYPIAGYPHNMDLILSEEGYGKNEYIETTRPIVVVCAPGPGSGKLATCLSQLYNENQRGIKAGYAKYETFPVWNLPLKHPVNIAYEAATADLNDVNMIDYFHKEAYGIDAVNYNRDLEAFPVLKKIFERIYGESPYASPTDMGVNALGYAIINEDAAIETSKQEIIRRYLDAIVNYKIGKVNQTAIDKISLLMNHLNISVDDRKCVKAAIDASKKKGVPCVALQIGAKKFITGKQSDMFEATAACIINAIKHLAKIPDDMPLLSYAIIGPIQELKKNQLHSSVLRLNLEEVLVTLAITATTNAMSQRAMEQLSKLEGAQMHSSVMLSSDDIKVLKKLKIDVTMEDVQSTKLLN